MRASSVLALIGSAATAFAIPTGQAPSSVQIVVETSHGGGGNDITSVTISVPVGTLYTNPTALAAVSTLSLLGSSTDNVYCTPYTSVDGTGNHGIAFSVGHPSYLSTNTVVVGSIYCGIGAPASG
ncbi:hypothetical protein GGR50DRAFT_698091 [Xylaria sp. CBS 124048]|nr:hypothetical protein GGR50DRAFT_698091 [Xylaria sp. CBS 124048]